ncbi:phage integrase SAM-like domain-containing protein [Mucilaginibacter sp.]
MATVKIILDKRTNRSDGTYSINFQICHNRKTTTRSSKIYVLESDWDNESKTIKKSNTQHKLLNIKLKKEYADIQSQLLIADDVKVQEFLKPAIQPQKPIEIKKTIFQFANELINQLKADNKIGNAWVYESTINVLRTFYTTDDLYFEAIDYEFLTRYNSFLVKRNIKHNTVYLYLRTIRIFYNKAIKLKIVDKGLYPFDDYKLRPEKTKKRAVETDILKAINNVELPIDTPSWDNRNYFVLSFYLIGISIVDLCLLTKENIKGGRILYKRRKTGKWYDIKLQAEAEEILNHYKGRSKYLLPIADDKAINDERLMRGIKYKTKVINKYLSRIAKDLKIDQKITTYTARHSWATIAKKAGFSIELIAEALGHEYGNRTTAVYLDNFDQSVIDDANSTVIKLIQ